MALNKTYYRQGCGSQDVLSRFSIQTFCKALMVEGKVRISPLPQRPTYDFLFTSKKGRSLNSANFFQTSSFNSSILKRCVFLRAAIIYVEITLTEPSTLALSFGVRTRAGITTVL